eukprot:238162_1
MTVVSRMDTLSINHSYNSDEDVLPHPDHGITDPGIPYMARIDHSLSENILAATERRYRVNFPPNVVGIFQHHQSANGMTWRVETVTSERLYAQCKCYNSFVSHIMAESKSIACNVCGVLLCVKELGYSAFSDEHTSGTGPRINCCDCSEQTEAFLDPLLDSNCIIANQRQRTNQELREQQQE